jgi:acyl-CoA thioesterase
LGESVALTVNFCSASVDGAFEARARPARTNRSTQHSVVELVQAGEVVMTATAMTAARRKTWSVDDEPMPTVPVPDAVPDPTQSPQVAWVRRYQMRFIEGGIPADWDGSGSSSQTRLWMREAAPRALDFYSIAAQADVFFPRAWLRRATRVPVGTVSMTVHFHAGAAPLAELGNGWVLGQARAQSFLNGFFDQTALLWSEGGHLFASSHQFVHYKA